MVGKRHVTTMCLLDTMPIVDTVGEFKFHAHIDVNSRLKLSIRNEFANGIDSCVMESKWYFTGRMSAFFLASVECFREDWTSNRCFLSLQTTRRCLWKSCPLEQCATVSQRLCSQERRPHTHMRFQRSDGRDRWVSSISREERRCHQSR